MSDDNIQVSFSANVAGLLDGLKKAQDSTTAATEGMKGDLGSLIESFEKFGMVTVAIGAVGIAFEGLKEAFNWVSEAVKQTYELAESFKKLGYETGATIDELNQYTVAIELSGGSTENLQGLMVGMQRGIKSNSDALIANGVAADKAALQGMSFEEYLRKVHETAEAMATPTEKEQFLILALGRAGATAGPMLKEFIENLAKGKDATIISPQAMANMEKSKESIGRLKIAQQEYAAIVSQEATPIADWFRDLHTWYLQQEIDHKKYLDYMHEDMTGAKYNEGMADMARENMHAKEGPGFSSEAKKHLVDPAVEAAKAKEAEDAAKAAYAVIKAVADNNAQFAQRQEERATQEFMHGLDERAKFARQFEENEKKAAREKTELAKLTAQDGINDAKNDLEMDKRVLDQKVEQGEISVKEELEQRKQLLAMEEALEVKALMNELKDDELTLVQRKRIENEMAQIHRKAALEMEKLDNQDATNWKKNIDDITKDWAGGIQKMLNHTMTLHNGVKNALMGIGDYFEKMVIQMGLDWVKTQVLILGRTILTNMGILAANEPVAASSAFMSTCAIPIVGPELAPAAAMSAEAWETALAVPSAAGGWDRVASDGLAMVHEKEMILPSSLAEGARNTFAAAAGGAGGGGETHLHFHTPDAIGAARFFQKYQKGMLSSLQGAAKNGRIR